MIYIESPDGSYRTGDKVTVFLEEKMGAFAVVFAYFLPFIIMISTLFFGYYNKVSEPVMGLSVLLSLALYFLALYLFRDRFSKKVTFKVKKQNINDQSIISEDEVIQS